MNQREYKHIFFDLDETLWDFKKNSLETLTDIYEEFRLDKKGIGRDEFLSRYYHHNTIYWDQYRNGLIEREHLRIIRFRSTLKEFEVQDEILIKNLSEKYLEILPTKTHLHTGAIEILEYLRLKYSLHIITNGFEEVQNKKLHHSKIISFFKYVITSEMAGSQKPNREIFKYALDKTNAFILNSVFIGDSIEADMAGAKAIGMDHVFFNPDKVLHQEILMHEIYSLAELKALL
ncbi:MAG: noncanonical pyrimidine nucleotidase, YjjG family [Chitinophagales bacterium]|nr:noncanonical pyrimidine nucleotidase, YjjG family [Chitinophagales bacterium]